MPHSDLTTSAVLSHFTTELINYILDRKTNCKKVYILHYWCGNSAIIPEDCKATKTF